MEAAVTLRGLLMSKDELIRTAVGQIHGRRWYQQCMEKAAWRTRVDSGF
jgi:hypothetical protein